MKKLAFFVFAALFASLTVNAQDFSKIAAKEAKSYKKQGWVVAPGQFPLEYQLARAYQLRSERDNNDYEVYVDGQAQSIGATYDAAKMQALEMAKLQLASKLQTQITTIIDNTVANNQLPKEQAESITKTVAASKTLISQNIGRVLTIVECYRELPKKNKEVLVQIFYNKQKAMAAAKRSIHEQMVKDGLAKEGEELHDRLDKILGY
ncbi:MAG: hypothetical protein IJB23_02985 [Alistipes sp.]|nr:hypothetical protein [Alistipes sp.]MBQ6869979.1 hypothetical protein [Alistipes sp.]MBQ7951488.1 hypothetical protein [Alistipes sp.]